ncbi:hypothetical protein ACFQS6_06900 [Xanthomonas populi]
MTIVPQSAAPQGRISTNACWLSVNHFPVMGSTVNAGALDTAKAKASQRVAQMTWLIGFVEDAKTSLACSPG